VGSLTAQKSQPLAGPFLTAAAAALGVSKAVPLTSIQPSAVMTPDAGQAPLVETTGVPE
jgi:hypothetical protein